MIPDADGDFSKAPNFNFNDGKVKLDTNWVSNANDNYGSASGFVPKLLFNEWECPGLYRGIVPSLTLSLT